MRTIRRSHGRGNASAVRQNSRAERLGRAPRATSSAAVLAPFNIWWRPSVNRIPLRDAAGRDLGEVQAHPRDGRLRYVEPGAAGWCGPRRTFAARTPHEVLSALLRACDDVLGEEHTRALLRRAVSNEAGR